MRIGVRTSPGMNDCKGREEGDKIIRWMCSVIKERLTSSIIRSVYFRTVLSHRCKPGSF